VKKKIKIKPAAAACPAAAPPPAPPRAPLTRELLHHRRRLAHELRDRDLLVVGPPVDLRGLARLAHEHARVGAHPGVGAPHVGREQRDLLDGRAVDEDRRQLALGREDDAVGGADAERGRARGDRVQRVLDLDELAAGGEGGEGEGVLGLAHRGGGAPVGAAIGRVWAM
jgi:hypothetical protein